ncbi:TolC family protein [Aquimarina hainanensis]|uniref:TolC family protein n=1 Tax=Aquimarina hainanensis TaxID=1578017 RepID=A0ABW5NCN2_9FLAO|nr:TolC family protein [Aquimarina sp. TRL1]QKX06699.1 TolC family protein [Aquimarina sp. TRL1]
MRISILLIISMLSSSLTAQKDHILTFREYLGYIIKYHPVVKQADLKLDIGQAKLMKARGAFDPKLEVDYKRKRFKEKTYYDKLNATFKIPTWYGIELKANFEENDGIYLNPEATVPTDGLYNAGISFSLAQGLLINERMASLKKAKFFKKQAKADRDLLVNQIIFDAAVAYFDWLKTYNEMLIYKQYVDNATLRFKGIKKSAELGEKATIDTVEAGITVQNRTLSLEQARVKWNKYSLNLATYLWINDNIPLELQEEIIPDINTGEQLDITFNTLSTPDTIDVANHPKVKSLEYKYKSLIIDKRLKTNKLLPKIDLEYNFLSETPDQFASFNTVNYKSGIKIRFPLFLRKERADLKLAKAKLQDTKLKMNLTSLKIKNKIAAIRQELNSFVLQNELIDKVVDDYTILLKAEERKFSLGESSLFLINSREKSLISAKLKANKMENKYFTTKATLFNSMAGNVTLQ